MKGFLMEELNFPYHQEPTIRQTNHPQTTYKVQIFGWKVRSDVDLGGPVWDWGLLFRTLCTAPSLHEAAREALYNYASTEGIERWQQHRGQRLTPTDLLRVDHYATAWMENFFRPGVLSVKCVLSVWRPGAINGNV